MGLCSNIILNILEFILAVVMAPIFEEIIFRGYLLKRISKKWGVVVAIVLSSFIFGFLHLLDFIGATIFGIFMAFLYLKTKNIMVPIICHFVNNLICVVLTYLAYYIEPLKILDEEITRKSVFDQTTIVVSIILVAVSSIVLWLVYYVNNRKYIE